MTRFAIPSLIALALLPQAAEAAQITAAASANIAKPVALTKLQDMDFGTLLVTNYTGTRNVVMSRAGAVTCPTEITCSGAPKQARFNVQGTNRMVVLINVASTGLVSGTTTIPFTADVASSFTLTNSGSPGTDFNVGGSIQVADAPVEGVYTGTFAVTADYQ